MARKKKPEQGPSEKWAVPYADFLSLLLALFIALFAISSTSEEKAQALQSEFVKIFDASPSTPVASTDPANSGSSSNNTSEEIGRAHV